MSLNRCHRSTEGWSWDQGESHRRDRHPRRRRRNHRRLHSAESTHSIPKRRPDRLRHTHDPDKRDTPLWWVHGASPQIPIFENVSDCSPQNDSTNRFPYIFHIPYTDFSLSQSHRSPPMIIDQYEPVKSPGCHLQGNGKPPVNGNRRSRDKVRRST